MVKRALTARALRVSKTVSAASVTWRTIDGEPPPGKPQHARTRTLLPLSIRGWRSAYVSQRMTRRLAADEAASAGLDRVHVGGAAIYVRGPPQVNDHGRVGPTDASHRVRDPTRT